MRLLRLLGKGDEQVSEAMNDILAQVCDFFFSVKLNNLAANQDIGRNKHRFVKERWQLYPLYEMVLTVLEIEADTGLRVVAINIMI